MTKKLLCILVVLFSIMAATAFGEEMQKDDSEGDPGIVVQEDRDCSGNYGCREGVRYRCTVDSYDKTCKWQQVDGTCSSSDPDVTPGGSCD